MSAMATARPARPSVGASSGAAALRRPRRTFRKSLRRAGWHLLVALVALVVAVLAGIIPYDTWRHQQSDLSSAKRRLVTLDREVARLEAQKKLLGSDAEVARLARQELGLAPKDAEIYAIPNLRSGDDTLSGDATPEVPTKPLGAESARADRSTASALWDAITFWS